MHRFCSLLDPQSLDPAALSTWWLNAAQQLPRGEGTGFSPHHSPFLTPGPTSSWAPGFMTAVMPLLRAPHSPGTLLTALCGTQISQCKSGSARLASGAGDPGLDQRCSGTRRCCSCGNHDTTPRAPAAILLTRPRGSACSYVMGAGFETTPDVPDHKARLPPLTKPFIFSSDTSLACVLFPDGKILFQSRWPRYLIPGVLLEGRTTSTAGAPTTGPCTPGITLPGITSCSMRSPGSWGTLRKLGAVASYQATTTIYPNGNVSSVLSIWS